MAKTTHKVARNSLINGLSFLAMALLGLLQVSLVIRYLGVDAQGFVAIAKLLTTGGYFSILTFGIPAILARKVAHYQAKEDNKDNNVDLQNWLGTSLGALTAMGLAIGLLIAIFYFGFHQISLFQKLSGTHELEETTRNFLVALIILSLPIQFFASGCQYVLIGTQNFFAIRSSEVATAVFGCILVLAFIAQGWPAPWLISGFLALDVLKSLFLALQVHKKFSLRWVSQGRWAPIKSDFHGELKVNSAASVLAFLDNIAPSSIMLLILGPAGLGVYDTLVKASKLIKTSVGFFNSSIVPHSVSMEARKGADSVAKLFSKTSFVIGFAAIPVIFVAAAISSRILRLWLGEDFSSYSLCFLVGLLTVLPAIFVGLLGAVFSIRIEMIQKNTWVNFGENIVGLPTLYLQAQHMGVLGVFLNRFLISLGGFFPRLFLTAKEYEFSPGMFFRPLQKIFLFSLMMFCLLWGAVVFFELPTWSLFLASLAALAAIWSLSFRLAENFQKDLILRTIQEIRRLV